jgi:hypothetical protein
MWNGISIVENDENHDKLKFKYEKNYIGKFSMQLTIELFILWWPIFYFLFWYYYDIFFESTFFIFYLWQT